MPQHAPMRQQILSITPTAFNQYGITLTMDQLAAYLRAWQPPLPFTHRSLTDKLQDLLATYRKLFTALVQITADSILLDPFRQAPPSLLLDMLLFGIARRAP